MRDANGFCVKSWGIVGYFCGKGCGIFLQNWSEKGILPQGFFASRKTLSAPEKLFGAVEQGIIV